MAQKKRRQRVGTLNYQKRKDITGKARPEDDGMGSGDSRVEGGVGSGDSRVQGGGDSRVQGGGVEGGMGSGDSRVEGGMGSGVEGGGDSRVEGGVESEELGNEGEQGSSSNSNEEELVTKRPRLSEIGAMAEEPVQSWLDHLPHDDLQHIALLLYARLPTVFGVQKTDEAVVVGKVLDKSECTIRRWVADFVSNGGAFSDSRQGHYIRNNTLMTNERARVYVLGKCCSTRETQPHSQFLLSLGEQ